MHKRVPPSQTEEPNLASLKIDTRKCEYIQFSFLKSIGNRTGTREKLGNLKMSK